MTTDLIWTYNQYSKTTGLLVHFLKLKIVRTDTFGYKYKDAYLYDLNRPELGLNIFMVYKALNKKELLRDKLLEVYPTHKLSYELPNTNNLVIVIPIPEEHIKDVEYFKKGEYSKINKDVIAEVFEPNDLRHHVCFKSKELKDKLENDLGTIISKDAELAPKPNIDREVLNYDISKLPTISWPDSSIPEQG